MNDRLSGLVLVGLALIATLSNQAWAVIVLSALAFVVGILLIVFGASS